MSYGFRVGTNALCIGETYGPWEPGGWGTIAGERESRLSRDVGLFEDESSSSQSREEMARRRAAMTGRTDRDGECGVQW